MKHIYIEHCLLPEVSGILIVAVQTCVGSRYVFFARSI
jgi:hypothetical protein